MSIIKVSAILASILLTNYEKFLIKCSSARGERKFLSQSGQSAAGKTKSIFHDTKSSHNQQKTTRKPPSPTAFGHFNIFFSFFVQNAARKILVPLWHFIKSEQLTEIVGHVFHIVFVEVRGR